MDMQRISMTQTRSEIAENRKRSYFVSNQTDQHRRRKNIVKGGNVQSEIYYRRYA